MSPDSTTSKENVTLISAFFDRKSVQAWFHSVIIFNFVSEMAEKRLPKLALPPVYCAMNWLFSILLVLLYCFRKIVLQYFWMCRFPKVRNINCTKLSISVLDIQSKNFKNNDTMIFSPRIGSYFVLVSVSLCLFTFWIVVVLPLKAYA